MSFNSLNLSTKLCAALPQHFSQPTKVQAKAIPLAVQGADVLALAQTGSGKTMAFALPLLNDLNANIEQVQAVIIVPTRELATQVTEAIAPIANALSLRCMCLTGGNDIENQQQQLRHTQIVVATPGRLLAFVNQGELDLAQAHKLVLDEADRLLDMGFWPDVQAIIAQLPNKRQTLLFSATLPQELVEKANDLLFKPKRVTVDPENSVAATVEEALYLVNKGSKAQALIALLKQHPSKQVLVFISAKDNADSLTKKLVKAKLNAAALHGNKSQDERNTTLDAFKQGQVNIIVATDVMARGIHIDNLPIVVNFDLPSHAATYVHRIGRTARAGAHGLAISLVSHSETDYLNAIRALTKQVLELQPLEGFPVTDKPASNAPASEQAPRKRPPKDKQANRRTAKKKSITQFKTKPSR